MRGIATDRAMVPALAIAYVAAWCLSPLVLHLTSDLDAFFWPAAETAVHGQPLHIYSTNMLGQGLDDNGPLGLLPLIPVVAVANLMGWADDIGLRTGITDAVFAIFALALAAAAIRVIRGARGALEWRLAAPCAFLLAPALWISIGDYGHLEQPVEVWLVILAVAYAIRQRWATAGIALGLAALTRSTAVLYIIPFAMLFLAHRRLRPTAAVLSVTALTAAIGLSPFLIADGTNVIHSLVTYRADLPIASGSFWEAARGASWAAVAQRGDAYLVLAVAAGLSAAILRHRPGVATTAAGLFGLLTVVAASFPMLATAAYPYYLLEPYVFATIWWLARPGSAANWRIAVPLLLTADAFIAKQDATLPFTGLGLIEGVTSSALLAIVIGLVLRDLLRVHTAPTRASAITQSCESALTPRLGENHVDPIATVVK
jgi:hypothetical protein